MRVVRAAEFGGPEVLVPGKAPEPAAGPRQVVVRARNTSTAPAMGDRRRAGRRAVLAADQWRSTHLVVRRALVEVREQAITCIIPLGSIAKKSSISAS
jgi:hypothetical protein